jgi:hypothetical protein
LTSAEWPSAKSTSVIWLRGNRRLRAAALLASVCVALGGLTFLAGIPVPFWGRVVGASVLGMALWSFLRLAWFVGAPRIRCDGRSLLVNLGEIRPCAIPLEAVECFFRGTGPTLLSSQGAASVRVGTIIIRIADRARQWHQRPVLRWLGSWSGGYVSLSGLWSEPITPQLLADLNRRLVAEHRLLRDPEARRHDEPTACQRP